MSTYLDLSTWPRRQHFEFFKTYPRPFFDVCVQVEVSRLLELTRRSELSSFVCCLYLTLQAANAVEPFRYRLRGERVLIHDRIHGGSTLLLDNECFAFGYFDFVDSFEHFHAAARAEIERVRASDGKLEPAAERDDLMHYSSLPWLAFTSFSHARQGLSEDSVPKIVFGKYHRQGTELRMPLSVSVHHALMDGLHVGRFVELFESYLAEPESALGLA